MNAENQTAPGSGYEAEAVRLAFELMSETKEKMVAAESAVQELRLMYRPLYNAVEALCNAVETLCREGEANAERDRSEMRRNPETGRVQVLDEQGKLIGEQG